MATPVPLRRLRWRGRGPGGALKLGLVACVAVPLAMLAAAPSALALKAPAAPAALAPSVLPSVCVGGVVLCNGQVITQPTPCVAGVVLCSPLPSACVGPLCTGTVIGPGPSPPANRTPTPGSNPSPAPVTGVSQGGGIGSTAAVASVAAPPGVGLVPPVSNGGVDDGLSPDAFSTILSLSLRDGLSSGGYHVWPWLLAIQLVLWTAIAGFSWSRPSTSSSRPRRS